jgi:HlyD family secretion protein
MNRKRIAIPIVLVIVIAAGLGVWWARSSRAESPRGASGTVEATESRLGFQLAGRIVSIAVDEGSRVKAGDVLAQLDAAELQARKAQAAARVSSAEAQVDELEGGFRPEEIAQAEAAVRAARDKLEDARTDLNRTRILQRGGAVSPEALQKATTAEEIAASALRQANEQLLLMRRGPRTEKIDAARAQTEEAKAAVQAVEAQLANAAIIAPHAGVVTVRHRQVNEIVAPGQPVLTVMNPDDRWVRIYVPENRVGAVRLGGRAAISADTFPGKTYQGVVTYISPEAEFTPKSVQTTEERVRLVYAVKVKVEGDPQMELKPGMPADVELLGQ